MWHLKLFEKTLHDTSPLRLRTMAQPLGWNQGVPANNEVTPGHAMALWLGDYLLFSERFHPDQVDLLLQAYSKALVQYGEELQKAIGGSEDRYPISHFMLAGARYGAVTGYEGFLDLTNGEFVLGLKRPPIKVVNYNLCQIYLSQLDKIKELRKPRPV